MDNCGIKIKFNRQQVARLVAIFVTIAIAVIHLAADTLPNDLPDPADRSPLSSRTLREVEVKATRPLSNIGLKKTEIDSAALRENISLSMADVIGYNTSLFVKTSGRATLSTVSFRGAAPSHTAVTWNGLPINSPALGMTDFSMIPAYLVDNASLLHGSSSLAETGGGLGGLISLASSPAHIPEGFRAQLVSGIGSFMTLDEFLGLSYRAGRWSVATRAVWSSSRNDFSFINHDKMLNIYDDNHQIISQYHPKEKNVNGAYRDLHLLQQVNCNISATDRITANIWYLASDREIPPTTVNYNTTTIYDSRQREETLRSVASWNHKGEHCSSQLRLGYAHTWLAYDYGMTLPTGQINKITTSRTHTNTLFADFKADYIPTSNLMLSMRLGTHNDRVRTANLASLVSTSGYNHDRTDSDLAITARWQATPRLAISALLREELIGSRWSPLIPAAFADFLLSRKANLYLKASISKNYHAPTLNDMYFQPGGNPDLRSERGFTYDASLSMSRMFGTVAFSAEAGWFDSYISDWIMWLPSNRGFFSPRNMKRVHSNGVEVKASASFSPFRDAEIDLRGTYSLTRSVNAGEPLSEFDKSVGKQLPYIPLNSASGTAAFSWREWSLLIKCCYYSKRYTMSSNENTISGSLPHYYMTDLNVERRFKFSRLEMSVKLAVNNLFDADYQSILAHPMPGRNFEAFLSLSF